MQRTKIKSKSKKQSSRDAELAKIKNKLPKVCCMCGREGNDLMHLLPKSQFPEHYTNPLNLRIGCRECHCRFDDDLLFRGQQKRLIQDVLAFDRRAAIRYFKLFDI